MRHVLSEDELAVLREARKTAGKVLERRRPKEIMVAILGGRKVTKVRDVFSGDMRIVISAEGTRTGFEEFPDIEAAVAVLKKLVARGERGSKKLLRYAELEKEFRQKEGRR